MTEHSATATTATKKESPAGGLSRRRFFVGLAVAMNAAMTQFAAAHVPEKNFVVHASPQPIPTIKFEDNQGQWRSLADFKGKTVLLNIWATWCVPCRREMPALDRLQAKLGGPDFEVVPVSVDRGGIEVVKKVYAEIGARNLTMYIDSSGQLLRAVGAVGLPTTLLVDRAGREIARIIGPAEWDAPEIADFISPIILRRGELTESIAQLSQT